MRRRPVFAVLLASVALALPALKARGADPLPKGEEVLDRYVEATGGKAAYEKVRNRVSKGTFEVTGQGIKGKIVAIEAAPNKTSVEVDLGPRGKIAEGTEGEHFWFSPATGYKLLEGDEKAEKIFDAAFNDEIRWKERYTKVECTGVEDVAGRPAYKVVLTPKAGRPSLEFYDKETRLQVKLVTAPKASTGGVPVEVYPSDYRKVDGILVAHRVVEKAGDQEFVVTLDEVKQNVDLPADTFKMPDGAKRLLDEKKGEK